MDRAPLEQMLGEGLSLAEIGRRAGRHESTVSYWVRRYGLRAACKEQHVAKGGLSQADLKPLVAKGLTVAEIATQVGRSKSTVRYWLQRYGLKTHNSRGRRLSIEASDARAAGLVLVELACRHHGVAAHVLDGRGHYRCRRCRAEAVSRRRRKVKATLVREAGGACVVCGYAKSMRALHFHHLVPNEKRIEINAKGVALALDTLRAEARKCVLLCSNCHAEAEDCAGALADQDGLAYNAARPPEDHPGSPDPG